MKGYMKDILSPHELHLPLNKKNPKTGISPKGLTAFRQAGHFDREKRACTGEALKSPAEYRKARV